MKHPFLKLLAALLLVSYFASSPQPTSAHHNTVWLLNLPGDGNQFTTYDYRQSAYGDVDWPVGFLFTGNAHVNRVKDGVCNLTTHPWTYCENGGPQYMSINAVAPGDPWTGFDSDTGRKRFSQNCSSTEWTSHMRIYAPQTTNGMGSSNDNFFTIGYGHMVVGTTHLDYQDAGGCSAREHGRSEIAENWFLGTLNGIPGWTVDPGVWDFNNANELHSVMRDVGGAMVPHVYDNDRMATAVEIP